MELGHTKNLKEVGNCAILPASGSAIAAPVIALACTSRGDHFLFLFFS